MFTKRTAFATNAELLNQRDVNRIVLQGAKPTTLIEKKAAAIYGHYDIPCVAQAILYNNFDQLQQILESASIELESKNTDLGMNYNPNDLDALGNLIVNPLVQQRILVLLQQSKNILPENQKHEYHRIQLTISKKAPTLTLMPQPIMVQHRDYEMVTSQYVKASTLAEFEYLCFNNRTQFRYMGATNFATYMYQNILYYLQLDETQLASTIIKPCANPISKSDPWQQRLAQLILRINFNSDLVTLAFYENTIQYHNIIFDTSFVPKYDVRAIEPQHAINYSHINDVELIAYHQTLDVRNTSRIPLSKIAIFLALPFKDGHFIKPCGTIVHVNLDQTVNRKSSRLILQDLCTIYDVESAIENAARTLNLDDAVYYAVNSKSLKQQALALMVIRRLVGDTVTISGHEIHLADDLNIMSWLEITCTDRHSVLPLIRLHAPASAVDKCVNMIQDIVASCCSKRGAAFLCSTYGIPEYILGNVYSKLKRSSEKYIFFTLVLQEYPLQMYDDLRCQLTNVVFGQNIIDLSANYKPFTRKYINSSVSERAHLYSEQLLRPDEVNSDVTLCNPIKCSEAYEYVDQQLNALVRNEPVMMNKQQIANFIALLLIQ